MQREVITERWRWEPTGNAWELSGVIWGISVAPRWPRASSWQACPGPPDRPPASPASLLPDYLPWHWFICHIELLALPKETTFSHILRLLSLPGLECPPLSSSEFSHPSFTAALLLPIFQLGKAKSFFSSSLLTKSLSHHQFCGFSLHSCKPPLLPFVHYINAWLPVILLRA